MSQKHEEIISEHLFYCFVDMEEENSLPITFILPSTVVAAALKEAHQLWLDTPGQKGQAHNDNKMRRLLPDYLKGRKLEADVMRRLGAGWMEQYREQWDILHLQ
jgi:hypothetical protein